MQGLSKDGLRVASQVGRPSLETLIFSVLKVKQLGGTRVEVVFPVLLGESRRTLLAFYLAALTAL